MFILEEYKIFVNQQIKARTTYYGKDTTNKYLEALYQFDTEPCNYLKDVHNTTLSKKYKIIFNELDKPVSVSYNYWFLYKFGYKRCTACSNILEVSSFNKDKHTWSKLHSMCKDCHCEQSMDYVLQFPEKVSITQHNYRKNNSDKLNEYNRKYRQEHLAEDAARSMKRYTRKLKAAPAWLTSKQLEQIKCFYIEANKKSIETGIEHQVDHIIPLQGDNVCGLHVPWNLQVLVAKENRIKSNKLLL